MNFKTLILFCILITGSLQLFAQSKPAHVFITAGQSNTDGRVKNVMLPAYIKSYATDKENFVTGSYRHCKIIQNRNDGQFVNYWPKGRITEGLWTYDAVTYNKIEQAIQQDFYVIKYAVGGTSIGIPNDTATGRFWYANEEWLKSTASVEKGGKSLLLSLTESIDAAIDNTLSKLANGYRIDAFLWHQGESDAKFAENYHENLKGVISYVRKYLTLKTGSDYSKLPFVFGSIPQSNRDFKPEIDAAMRRIAAEDPFAFLVDMAAQDLQPDRLHFTETSAEYLGLEMYKVLEKTLDLSGTGFRVAKFRDDKQCAISYTFDDGLTEHATLVAPRLEKLGFRGTFWVNGNTIDNPGLTPDKPRVSWKQLKEMTRRGHEISNHGWAHKNMNRLTDEEMQREIEMNDSAIYVNTGFFPTTFCYPFNAKNSTAIALASENRVATRTEQFAMGGKSTHENLEQKVAELIKNRQWGVAMIHGISYGYDHFTSADIFLQHLDKVKALEDKIWVGTFAETGAYVRERDEILYEINKLPRGFVINPSLKLDKMLFTQPLTGVIDRSDIRKISITQNKRKIKARILVDKVIFNFNPFGGEIKILITGKNNNR